MAVGHSESQRLVLGLLFSNLIGRNMPKDTIDLEHQQLRHRIRFAVAQVVEVVKSTKSRDLVQKVYKKFFSLNRADSLPTTTQHIDSKFPRCSNGNTGI